MDRERGSTSLRCRACGSDTTERARSERERAVVYQVIVACASCRTPFVAIGRN